MYSNKPIIQNIQELIHNLSEHKKISLMWIPAHIGISKNVEVDQLAKRTIQDERTTHISIPVQDCMKMLKNL